MKGSNEIILSWSLLAAAAAMSCYYMISFELEKYKAEAMQPSIVTVQPGYLACTDEIAAQQSLLVDDVNVLVDAGRCLPTEEMSGSPAEILDQANQFYFVRVNLPDDISADLWLPTDAAK